MKHWVKHIVAAGVAVAIVGAGIAATRPAHADAIKDRRAEMKKMARASKALAKAAKARHKATARHQALIILASADRLSSLFPRGTNSRALGTRVTRAKRNIWSDWTIFKARLNGLKKVANRVAKGNLAAAKGLGKACGSCHKRFRARKPRKK